MDFLEQASVNDMYSGNASAAAQALRQEFSSHPGQALQVLRDVQAHTPVNSPEHAVMDGAHNVYVHDQLSNHNTYVTHINFHHPVYYHPPVIYHGPYYHGSYHHGPVGHGGFHRR